MSRQHRPDRRLRRRRFAACVGLCVATALGGVLPARAEQSDRSKPINFSGDTGDANLQARGGALTGNVIITQGTLSIRADRVVFKQNNDNSLSATAYGNPVAIRQKRDGVDEYYEGYAQRLEYDGSKELVELFDRALLKRGQDEIRSNYVSYNTATEVFRAEGREGSVPDPTGPGARVRGMFQPRSEPAPPGKEKDKEKDGKGKAKDKDGARAAVNVTTSGTSAATPSGTSAATSAATPAAGATPPPPLTLKPAGDLAPAPAK